MISKVMMKMSKRMIEWLKDKSAIFTLILLFPFVLLLSILSHLCKRKDQNG